MSQRAVSRTVRFAAGLFFWVTLGPALSGVSAAADLDPMFRMRSLFSEIDVGLSGWVSQGRGTWSHNASGLSPLLGNPTSSLDFKKVSSNIAEGRVRLVHQTGILLRGQLGYGGIAGGTLIDDDYVSAAGATALGTSVSGTHRVSRTESPLDGNSLWYVNADLGYRLLSFPGHHGHVDAFVGYQLWREQLVAKGLRQLECTAVGTFCSPVGATEFQGVPAITNTTLWQSLRVGAEFQMDVTSRVMVKLEGVVMPYSHLRNEDIHHLRGDLQQNPSFVIKGTGWGYTLDGQIGYRILPALVANVGYRFWWQRVSDAELTNFPLGSASSTMPAELRTVRQGVTFGLDYSF